MENEELNIMIVDDELLIRKTLHRVFSRNGHNVMALADGQEALENWPDFVPDLVILDVLMPKIGGVEVIQTMKAEHPELLAQATIVMISAYSAGGTKEDFVKLGATDFQRKPFEDVHAFVHHCIILAGGKL